MNIIASMTTIPSRIDRIRPVLDSILAQSVATRHIEMNIPFFCVRTEEPYVIPDWLQTMKDVHIHRTEDYGAITKVAPTLLRHRHDQDTYIWSVDDDCAYPSNQLELLYLWLRKDEHRILTRHGGNARPDGSIQFIYGDGEVSMFEGFGGVLYPPGCIAEDFADYVRMTSENAECRISDDVVLSFYFNSRGIPIFIHNRPTDAVPFLPTGWQSYSDEKDALRQQNDGHLERYKRVYEHLRSVFGSARKNDSQIVGSS
jgi:hypothetical protein